MPRKRKIDFEAANKRQYVREHGSEPAYLDVDDLTAAERRAKRAPLTRAEKEALARLGESLDKLKRQWDRLEIEERDRRYAQQKQTIQSTTRLARERLGPAALMKLDGEFDDLRDAAIGHLGPPPARPAAKTATSSKGPRPAASSPSRVVAKLALKAKFRDGKLRVSWDRQMNVEQWHVVVTGGSKELWKTTERSGLGKRVWVEVPGASLDSEPRVTVKVDGRNGVGHTVTEGSKVVSLS